MTITAERPTTINPDAATRVAALLHLLATNPNEVRDTDPNVLPLWNAALDTLNTVLPATALTDTEHTALTHAVTPTSTTPINPTDLRNAIDKVLNTLTHAVSPHAIRLSDITPGSTFHIVTFTGTRITAIAHNAQVVDITTNPDTRATTITTTGTNPTSTTNAHITIGGTPDDDGYTPGANLLDLHTSTPDPIRDDTSVAFLNPTRDGDLVARIHAKKRLDTALDDLIRAATIAKNDTNWITGSINTTTLDTACASVRSHIADFNHTETQR